jgi:hypothetical protein
MTGTAGERPPYSGPIMGCFGLASVPLGMGFLFLLWLIGLAIFG